MASKHLPAVDEQLRIVLVGKTGDGKTATMNTLMGRPGLTEVSASSRTTKTTVHRNGNLLVIDTPGIIHTKLEEEELRREIVKCIMYAAPGPHAIVYVLQPRKLTEEDTTTKQVIQSIFGNESNYMLILYTWGDELKILQDDHNKNFRKEFGDRLLIFNNKDESPDQVSQLLEKLNNMVKENREKEDRPYYNDEMFEKAQKVLEHEKTKRGMKPTDTPSQDVWESAVDALIKSRMGEPLETTVKEILGWVERKVVTCATQ